jgi:hypothetical protein
MKTALENSSGQDIFHSEISFKCFNHPSNIFHSTIFHSNEEIRLVFTRMSYLDFKFPTAERSYTASVEGWPVSNLLIPVYETHCCFQLCKVPGRRVITFKKVVPCHEFKSSKPQKKLDSISLATFQEKDTRMFTAMSDPPSRSRPSCCCAVSVTTIGSMFGLRKAHPFEGGEVIRVD